MVNTRTVHAKLKRESERERKKKEKKEALILPNDWSHVVKGKIRLLDTGAERVEHEGKMSERETEI